MSGSLQASHLPVCEDQLLWGFAASCSRSAPGLHVPQCLRWSHAAGAGRGEEKGQPAQPQEVQRRSVAHGEMTLFLFFSKSFCLREKKLKVAFINITSNLSDWLYFNVTTRCLWSVKERRWVWLWTVSALSPREFLEEKRLVSKSPCTSEASHQRWQ